LSSPTQTTDKIDDKDYGKAVTISADSIDPDKYFAFEIRPEEEKEGTRDFPTENAAFVNVKSKQDSSQQHYGYHLSCILPAQKSYYSTSS
jgi:hypothetical protein